MPAHPSSLPAQRCLSSLASLSLNGGRLNGGAKQLAVAGRSQRGGELWGAGSESQMDREERRESQCVPLLLCVLLSLPPPSPFSRHPAGVSLSPSSPRVALLRASAKVWGRGSSFYGFPFPAHSQPLDWLSMRIFASGILPACEMAVRLDPERVTRAFGPGGQVTQ